MNMYHGKTYQIYNEKTYPIRGMHCASCVQVIERAVRKIDGVEDCTVNLATEQATVTYNAEKVLKKKNILLQQ